LFRGLALRSFTVSFLIFFAVVVVVRIRVFRCRGDHEEGILSDNWTFPVIFASYVFVVMAGLAEFFYRSPEVNLWVSGTGYSLAIAGVVTTRRCVLTLGPWWSIRIEIKKDHRVVDKGPYRFCRHPYYLATLLELGGFCLILNSYRALLYFIFVHIPCVVARIFSEERVLAATLGARYLDYQERVRILPFPISFTRNG